MKISDIFNIISENHKFTEEYIYKNQGEYPIYSATLDKPYGFTNSYDFSNEIILVVNYGDAGKTRIINGKYNIGRNVTGLELKPEYIKKINLKYLNIILEPILLDIADKGNMGCVSQNVLKNVIISNIPNIEEQNKIVEFYEKLETYKNMLIQNIEEIEDTMKQLLSLKNTKQFIMNDIALFNKGSNKISEESIYQNFDKDGIPIYSSATENKGLMGKVSKSYYKNMDKKGNKGELTWTTNGYAGVVFYRDTNYLYSEKCGRIIIRKDYKNFINPKFLMYQLNNITYKYKTSESNNGKLDIIHMKHIPILLPIENDNISIDIQNKVVEQYEKLEKMKYDLQSILDEINKTL